MKFLKNILILFIVSFFLLSCDKVDDPFAHIEDTGGQIDKDLNTHVHWTDSTLSYKKIVIEDFTGHICQNCPTGTDIANGIIADNPNHVMIIGIHNSGAFSAPHPPEYPEDFQTSGGEKLRAKFNVISFPNGMINRKEINSQTIILPTNWENNILKLLNDAVYMDADFSVKAKVLYNDSSKEIGVDSIKITALKNITGEISINFRIIQDSIIAPQKDQRKNPARIEDYQHNHVLRTSFPLDGDGEVIFQDPTKDEVYLSNSQFTEQIDEEWYDKKCEIIITLINRDTKEILYVDKVHIR